MTTPDPLTVLCPAPDFWPDRLALLRAGYPRQYGRGALRFWLNAALGAAMPDASAHKDPHLVQRRLQLYLFAMLETRRAMPGDSAWHGVIDTVAGACARLYQPTWPAVEAALRDALPTLTGAVRGHDAETRALVHAYVLCYARTFFEATFAGQTPYADWGELLVTL
jgi:hypothetical protein